MTFFDIKPSIDIIFGPMFSGKTTELVRRLSILSEANLRVLYINSVIDTRGEIISTHNKSLNPKINAIKLDKLYLTDIQIDNYDIFGIDESQFFNGLKEFCLFISETKHKKVIVSGLNGDFKRSPFGEINDLIPFCDTITKLYPFCQPCRKMNVLTEALFSKRITYSSDNVIEVGASDLYIPTCRSCYNK